MTEDKQRLLHRTRRTVLRFDRRLRALDGASRRLGWTKLGIFISGAAASYAAFQAESASVGWITLFLFLCVYVYFSRRHKRVDESIRKHRIMMHLKATGTARMELNWKHIPSPAHFAPPPGHPFQFDLDLTGERSLHHLLDTSITQGGSERLMRWLLETEPDIAASLKRQEAVGELAPMIRFRERLALTAALVSGKSHDRWELEGLAAWLEKHTHRKRLKPFLILLGALAGLNITLLTLYLYSLVPGVWIISFIAYFSLYMFRVKEYRDLFDDAYYLDSILNRFKAVMMYLERYPCGDRKNLERLCSVFQKAENRPSRFLRRIGFLAGAAAYSQTNHAMWLLLNAVVPWDMFFFYRLERYKEEIRERLIAWMDSFYELEALCSLASFAHQNPGYTFPFITEEAAGEKTPLFSAAEMGHPLLPDHTRVCNEFTLSCSGEITIITGSNMSGKSTFLRTIGVNLTLAFAGGPVNAETLRTVPFRLFTCINVTDSLSDSISYFYAEVKRLKALLNELERVHRFPVLFLIDEIFRGTNYRERMIGSRAYVKALTELNGTGIISTHDLELVKLADEVTGIRNYHFRETIENGMMLFEYKLHDGPCPTTNALKIMEMEGLPVNTEKPD